MWPECGLPPLPAISALTWSVGSPCSNLILGRNKLFSFSPLSLSRSLALSFSLLFSLFRALSFSFCVLLRFQYISWHWARGNNKCVLHHCRHAAMPHCRLEAREPASDFGLFYSRRRQGKNDRHSNSFSLQTALRRSSYMAVK